MLGKMEAQGKSKMVITTAIVTPLILSGTLTHAPENDSKRFYLIDGELFEMSRFRIDFARTANSQSDWRVYLCYSRMSTAWAKSLVETGYPSRQTTATRCSRPDVSFVSKTRISQQPLLEKFDRAHAGPGGGSRFAFQFDPTDPQESRDLFAQWHELGLDCPAGRQRRRCLPFRTTDRALISNLLGNLASCPASKRYPAFSWNWFACFPWQRPASAQHAANEIPLKCCPQVAEYVQWSRRCHPSAASRKSYGKVRFERAVVKAGWEGQGIIRHLYFRGPARCLWRYRRIDRRSLTAAPG